jgi:hypothetical protein
MQAVPRMQLYAGVVPYHLRRQCVEVTLYTSAGSPGLPSLSVPNGYSGQIPFKLGNPFPDSIPGGTGYAVGFSITPSFNCLADYANIGNMFKEYQLDYFDTNFALTVGASYNYGLGCPLPEVTVAYDPNDAGTPASIMEIEAFPNMKRQVLANDRNFTVVGVPHPALLLYNGATPEYAFMNNVKQLWCNINTSADLPHYCFKGVVRNLLSAAGPGIQVRMTFNLYFSVRRVY